VSKSENPGDSLYAYIAGAPAEVLVDDQSLITKINKLECVVLDDKHGMVFYAKDSETLLRGLDYVYQSPKTRGKREYWMRSADGGGLAAMSITWDHGISRHTSPLIAAFVTVGFNASLAIRREIFRKFHIKIGDNDQFQSVSGNMDAAGRDGRLLRRGAALYVCQTSDMPTRMPYGRTYRQIGDILTLGVLATVGKKLFA